MSAESAHQASEQASQVGDKILYSKYGGTEVHYQGEDYLIVAARDVLAVLA